MWRTVSARIRGAKQELVEMGEDTDGMVESTSKLRDQIKALTGFDIMEDENTYKDIMEIIIGIGEAWEDLTDLEQAGLLESLAGKQQSNALAAALNNVDMIKEAYETAQNAEGSAQEELNAYMESIDGKIAQLTNRIQQFWATAINSDSIKDIVDALTVIVEKATEFIDTIGLAPIGIAAITAALLKLTGIKVFSGGGRVKNICCIMGVNYPTEV